MRSISVVNQHIINIINRLLTSQIGYLGYIKKCVCLQFVIKSNIMELDTLLSAFEECVQIQYNGNLNFKDTLGNEWTFYYHLGQIVWATGGIHPRRRWLRNIALICPELDISDGAFNRVRAKIFGATDFINKPIEKDSVFAILNKYLYTGSMNKYCQNFALSYSEVDS